MADASSAPRRVSMAYILGFSNKPFKDGGPPVAPPAPRHPSAFKQMVTTPGGVLEWTASDGRRGRLTGSGRPRLTAISLAQMPGPKTASGKAASKNAAEGDDGGIVCAGLVDAAFDDKPASSTWTKEQDMKLLELRGDNPNEPWDDVAKTIDNGQQGPQCKERFKQIRPKDWKPKNAKGGGGGKQKQDNQKAQKGQTKHNDGEKQDAEKKDSAADGGFDASGNNGWDTTSNIVGWNTSSNIGGGGGDGPSWSKSNGASDTPWDAGNTGTTDNNGSDNKADEGFKNDGVSWGADSGDNGATGDWQNNAGAEKDASEKSKNNDANTGGAWNADDPWSKPANDASKDGISNKAYSKNGSSSIKNPKEPSHKAPSHSGSRYHFSQAAEKPSASRPREYELKPDLTFSADDLRVIAKILQQDCQMVWNRVSWRFKDKTGRNLDPDVFERKITGQVEKQGSERERR